ncbi:MAG: outer membrane protein [Pseudooceanicola sp.]
MFRKIAFAALSGSILATPVLAGNAAPAPADPVPMAPAPVVMQGGDWTGGFGGVQLGYGDFSYGGASGDGVVGGLQLGYDYDFGNIVVGGEFDYTVTDITMGGTDLDDVMRAKLRVGYDTGNALIYGVGGPAWAGTSAGDDVGWAAGIGAEYKIRDNVSVGAEYLYHKFDDFNSTGSDLDGSTISAKVNYRF